MLAELLTVLSCAVLMAEAAGIHQVELWGPQQRVSAGYPEQQRGRTGRWTAETESRRILSLPAESLCEGREELVPDPNTGLCVRLLQRASCPDGHWLVLHVHTGHPVCRPRPAVWQSACPAGMKLLPDQYGLYSCDCLPEQLYWRPQERCYPARHRGPCPVDYQLQLPEDHLAASCRKDPTCHHDSCPPTSTLDTRFHSTGVLSGIRLCPRGSKRSVEGRCRWKPITQSRTVEIPKNRSACGPGMRLTRRGKCALKVLIFGK